MAAQLSFGVRDGILLHVTEVKNGLACNCVCAQCGAQLVARNNGRVKTAHFAHYSVAECEHAVETSLHLAAKAILESAKTVRLPAITWGNHIVCREQLIKIDSVRVEYILGDIKPDVVVEAMGHTLLIEIAVTHFIDAVKEEKIRSLSISTVEINLSAVKESWTLDKLRAVLIEQVANKAWIFSKKLEAFKVWKLEQIRIATEQQRRGEEEKKQLVAAKADEDKRKLARYLRDKDYKVFKGFNEPTVHCPKKVARRKEFITLLRAYPENSLVAFQTMMAQTRWSNA